MVIKAKDGAIEITMKKVAMITDSVTPSAFKSIKSDKIFTRVETPPQFPGGDIAWNKYITETFQNNIDLMLQARSQGTCIVKFIVDTDGTISNVEATTLKGTILAKVAIDAIKKGPKWIPAMQNDHIVAAYKEQPVTFKIADNITVNKEPQ